MLKVKKSFKTLSKNNVANKLAVLTAYDFNTARSLETAGIDTILVGDSLAMVFLGHADTTQITAEEMFVFTRAVRNGAPNTTIIADLPLKSIRKNLLQTVLDCKKFIECGANIIKVEGADDKTVTLINELSSLGIPVLGHIGYTPQNIEKFPKSTMVTDEAALMKDAKLLEGLGVVGMVLEMVEPKIAEKITDSVAVPTIGIGSGKNCDGQVLVTDDLLGRYSVFKPKFVKRYAEQFDQSVLAVSSYIEEVRNESFPV